MASAAVHLQAGALEVESGELRFETSADGRRQEVVRKAELPMMATVAEAMIAANCAVAAFTAAAFPHCALLRRHASPRVEAFAEVGPCTPGKTEHLSCLHHHALKTQNTPLHGLGAGMCFPAEWCSSQG